MHLHPDGYRGGEQIRVASSSASVQEALEVLHDRVIFKLEGAFDKWLAEPNQVAEAIVEEFVDSVLRAETAQDEWRSFYLENRAAVWRAEFDQIGAHSRLRQEWESAVEQVSTANHPTALRLFS